LKVLCFGKKIEVGITQSFKRWPYNFGKSNPANRTVCDAKSKNTIKRSSTYDLETLCGTDRWRNILSPEFKVMLDRDLAEFYYIETK
jgi:hypothetical protein